MAIFKSNFKIGNIIKRIDLFGSTINLTIKHKRTSQTKLGGCLTILAAIFFIIYGIINSKNLINRLNPVVTRFGVYDKQYIKVEDSFSKIPIAVSYGGMDMNQFRNYFTIYVYYEEYYRVNNTYLDTSIIPLVNCTREHFINVSNEIYEKEIYGSNFCLDMTELKNKSLFYSDGIEGVIYIYFTYCGFLFEDYCLPKQEIMDHISYNQGDFSVTIGVGGINPLNYEEPVQYFIQKKTLSPSLHFVQGLDVYIYQEELETDDGLFMKNDKRHYSYNILEYQTFFEVDPSDTVLAYIRIHPSNSSYYNKRVYTKIQDYLSQLGGMIGLAFNILPYIVYIFSIGLRDETILNTLIEFKNDKIKYESLKNTNTFRNYRNKMNYQNKIDEKNRKKFHEESSSQINIKKSSKENNYINEKNGKTKLNKEQDLNLFLENWKNRKINKIKFSNFEILNLYLCNCNCIINRIKSKKILIYYKYKKMIQNYFEFPFLINKIEENDKLKYILFNKKQLSLFKFISNDIIYTDNFTIKKNNLNQKKLFYNNDREIASHLLSFLNQDKKQIEDKYEKRLITFFFDRYNE